MTHASAMIAVSPSITKRFGRRSAATGNAASASGGAIDGAQPVSAAVSANIGTIDSDSIALATQTAVITQHLEDVTAQATVNQDSEIDQ